MKTLLALSMVLAINSASASQAYVGMLSLSKNGRSAAKSVLMGCSSESRTFDQVLSSLSKSSASQGMTCRDMRDTNFRTTIWCRSNSGVLNIFAFYSGSKAECETVLKKNLQ